MKVKFNIVDVFTDRKYAGNQLAVYQNTGDISDEKMLLMAKETNFQESTFILADETQNGGYDVKIFTPEYEVPFAGHPTIGTAYILKKYFQKNQKESVILNLKIGQVPVIQEDNTYWLSIKNPKFSQQFSKQEMGDVFSLSVNDFDATLPIEIVSTGLPFCIIPLASIGAIKRFSFDVQKIEQWMVANKLHKSNSENGLNIYFFFFVQEAEDVDNQLHARMIGFENGIMREDPATGSANSCLLAYLLKYQANSINLNVEQGYEMERPSLIKIRGSRQGNDYELQVGGQVVEVAEGVWHV